MTKDTVNAADTGRHIAFVNIPAIGHVYPTLAVVAELARRGHRISYVCAGSRADVLQRAGATVVPYRSRRPADDDPDVTVPRRDGYISHSLLSFLDEAEAALESLDAALHDDRPDLVVFDRMAFAGRVFAAQHGLPTVQLWPMMVSNEHWSMGQAMNAFDPTDPVFHAFLARLDTVLTGRGLSMDAATFLSPDSRRHLAFYPRAFQNRGELFDDSYRFVGPCLRSRPTARDGHPAWSPSAGAGPVLLVTLGTIYNNRPDFYRACVTAFAGTPWHVVLAVGKRTDPATLGAAPDNVEIHQEVPQLDVLAHATALLSHAGMGGVMEALSVGVPVLAAPQTLEQEVNADRIDELGLGVRLPDATADPDTLRRAADLVAEDDAVTKRLHEMRREIAAAGGTARAADIIEECLPG
jgi:MGT family glycosyltransferase